MHRRTPPLFWLALAASCAASAAYALATRRSERHFDARIAALASSVEGLRREPAPPQIVERHTTHEVVREAPGAASAAHPEPERESPKEAYAGPFDRSDVRDYSAGRGPHPVERRFERERASGRVAAELQQRFDAALGKAVDGLDVDLLSADCRTATCRVEVTFDSTAAGVQFVERLGMASPNGPPLFDHGGLYATLHEDVGGRHHSVYFVLRREGSEG
jgi:hypothetical protein